MTYSYPKALYIVRLQVDNISIISSHLTWGFPAPSAFTGFAHALQRKLNAMEAYEGIICGGIGIICHQFMPQVTKSSDYRYSPYQLNLARHPLEADGSTPALVEEGKGNMEVSLIIGLTGETLDTHLSANDAELNAKTQDLINKLNQLVYGMRLAGGVILPHQRVKPKLIHWSSSVAAEKTRALRRYLLPGFALIHRHDVLVAHQQWLNQQASYLATQGSEANLLDTLLDISRLNLSSTAVQQTHELQVAQAEAGQIETVSTQPVAGNWQLRVRPAHLKGWLVPIPIGYGAITEVQPAGSVTGARDDQYPVTFVETLMSLGEWKSPHRIDDLSHILWAYDSAPDQGLYSLIQPFAPTPDNNSSQDDLDTQSIDFSSTDTEEEEY